MNYIKKAIIIQCLLFSSFLIILYVIIPVSLRAQTIINITDEVLTDTSLTNTIVNMYGKSELHLTDDTNPIPESMINLYSEDAWLFFDHIKPSFVRDSLLNQIKISDQDADVSSNVRVVIYLNGTVVIPHAPGYKPLTVYTDSLYGGESMQIRTKDYYWGPTTLSSMNDTISSFRLKRGYMATFAQDPSGGGFSKVYVAQDGDINIEKLPEELNDQVSFIRAMPWKWVNKKGFCGDYILSADTLGCSWYYDWGTSTASTNNVEFVPMHWGGYNSSINSRKDVTHTLGFNEPDHEDQANLTVDEAISKWPDLLRSGLRIGSPGPSDGGLNWLYNFIDKADALNYRVDFVAVHYYKGGWTVSQFYNWLKEVHERTGRPLWITEWNNGANWTCCDPTYEEQAQFITEALAMFDTTSFIERYSIYNWVEETRAVIANFRPYELTPAGVIYRDFQASMAYYDPGDIPVAPTDLEANAVSSIQIDLSWTDNADNEAGFKIERKTDTTSFEKIARIGSNVTTYADKNLVSGMEYYYRVTAYNAIGDSRYSNIASDTTIAGVSILPQNGWKLHYVDSEELTGENGTATNAFDGNTNTFWHTEWYNSTPVYPHEIQIDIGKSYPVTGLLYLPRQDGNINGTIAGYEIYVSEDDTNWGDAVASGTWANNSEQKEVDFNTVDGQYVRLLAKSEVNGNAWASVAEINILVEGDISSINENFDGSNLPGAFLLKQNYPNPFNPTTIIKFSVPRTQHVTLKVFDLLGREVATLMDEKKSAGIYRAEFNASFLPSGIYMYRIQAGTYSSTKKMILLR
jgi:hypothetical protein